MKTTTLKLSQVLNLKLEIDNIVKEDIAYKTKYWLNKLSDSINKEGEGYEKIRVELIEKYGENNAVTPESKTWESFVKEISDVLNVETEITHCDFNIDDFNFKSGNNYPIFDLLVSVPE